MDTPLNPRRQTLLALLVEDYIKTAAPVASQQIARAHDLKVSSATIRNDMAELEEMGFISRPHTSAGGIPADSGYRFYVERAALKARPTRSFEESVRDSIRYNEADPLAWARAAAAVLSQSLHNVAIATSPRAHRAKVKQLQLVHLHDAEALLVLVLQEARVIQRLVTFEGSVAQEDLTALAIRLNGMLEGKTTADVRRVWDAGDLGGPLAEAVVQEVAQLLGDEDGADSGPGFTDGLGEMLDQPEFQASSRARDAVELVEDGKMLRVVLTDHLGEADVDVLIGNESGVDDLRPFSFVVARYGTPGQVPGVIGALGPTRMDYVSAVASVRYLASFLNQFAAALDEPSA